MEAAGVTYRLHVVKPPGSALVGLGGGGRLIGVEGSRRTTAARTPRFGGGRFLLGARRGLQEGGRLAGRPVLAAQHTLALAGLVRRGRGLRRGQRRRLRLDDAERVAIGALATVTIAPELAAAALAIVLPVVLIAAIIALEATLAVALTAITLAAITLGPVALAPIGAAVVLAVLALLAIVARTVVAALALLAEIPIFPRAVVALTVITLGAVVALPVIALAVVTLPRTLALPLLAVGSLGLGALLAALATLFLEVDVVAGRETVAANDLADWTLRLHGAQHAEVMLGVLQVVLGQHAVAG